MTKRREPTRREFLREAACGGAALALGLPLAAEAARKTSAKRTRVVLGRSAEALNDRGLPDEATVSRMLDDAVTALFETEDPRDAWSALLSPGDVLFIPRGFVHYGHTTDQPSVHVTLGVLPYTLSDVVRNALKRFDDPWLRELAFADSRAESELPEALDDAFEGLLDRLIEVEPDDALDHLAATFVETSTPRRRGGLAELSRVEAISADTPLRRRPGVLWRAAEREGQLTLSFHGAHVPLDAGAPAAALLAGDDAFPAGRLPAPDPLALARRLVAAGFLPFAG